MYLTDIKTKLCFPELPSHDKRGIMLADRDALGNALRTLGRMTDQDPAKVDALLGRMLEMIDSGYARSGLAAALMRNDLVPAGPVSGPGRVVQGGWVIGAKFAEHNTWGLPQLAPFLGLGLRINEYVQEESGAKRYKLSVTRNGDPSLDPMQPGLYHTEALLAAELGMPRRLSAVEVIAFYEQVGATIEFNLATIVEALSSVEGLSGPTKTAEAVAAGYFRHIATQDFKDWSFQLQLGDPNGNRVTLCHLAGMEERTRTVVPRLLVELDGHLIRAPRSDLYRNLGPYATFTVLPPKHGLPEDDPAKVRAANQELNDLADAVTTALWANNNG